MKTLEKELYSNEIGTITLVTKGDFSRYELIRKGDGCIYVATFKTLYKLLQSFTRQHLREAKEGGF